MSKATITIGMTADDFITAVNNNYSELYLTGIIRVGSGGYSTIQAGINAASTGEVVQIAPGTYSEQINLKDGVDLVGIGKVVISNTGVGDYNVDGSGVTCKLKNITISGSNVLRLITSSNVSFTDVEFTGTLGSVLINASTAKFRNCYFNTIVSVAIQAGSVVEIDSRTWGVDSTTIIGNSKVSLFGDIWQIKSTGSAITVGTANQYRADLTGVVATYKDKTCTNFAEFIAENSADKSTVNISFKNTGGTGISSINANAGCVVSVSQTDGLNDYNKGGIFSITASDQSLVRVLNSQIQRIAALHGAVFEGENSLMQYDRDLLPLGDVADIYDESIWLNYAQGSHVMENGSLFNKDMIATIKLIKCVVNYMGDDVLNGLPIDIALKNLAVNTTFKSDTTSDPDTPTPIHAAWETGHLYTAGEFVPAPYSASYHDTVLLYVVENHTSTTIDADWKTGKIRTLFGAKLQDNGYYGQLYYSTTTSEWLFAHRLGAYHGGKFRNRGVAMYNSTSGIAPANLIFIDTTINDHSNSWSLSPDAYNVLSAEGAYAYGGGVILQAGASYTYYNGVNFNFINYWRDGGTHKGIYLVQNTQLDKEEHHIYNVKFTGKAITTGLYIYVTKVSEGVSPANNTLYFGNVFLSESEEITPANYQYIQGSALVVITTALITNTLEAYQTYYASYIIPKYESFLLT